MGNKHNKIFTYSGMFGVGVVYIVLLLILILCFVLIKFEVGLFVGLLCALTIICGVVALIVYFASRHVAHVEKQTKAKLDEGKYKTPKRGGF